MSPMGDEHFCFHQARLILGEWAGKRGQDRCWYYPDVLRRLMLLFGVPTPEDRGLPPRPEFEEGCRRFQDEEYGAK